MEQLVNGFFFPFGEWLFMLHIQEQHIIRHGGLLRHILPVFLYSVLK